MRPLISASGSSKFTTLGSFEYRPASLLSLSNDEPRSASCLIGRSAVSRRSARVETASKISDRPPERLRNEPGFRNRGNLFCLLNGPCRSGPGGKFPDTPGIQSTRNPPRRRCAGISRSTLARAHHQAAAPLASAGNGASSSPTNQGCRGLLERRHLQQQAKGFCLGKTNRSWQ